MNLLKKEAHGSWLIWFKNGKKIKKIKINEEQIKLLQYVRRNIQDILSGYNIQ